MRTVFAEAHRLGAEEFGGLWLKANDHVVHRAIGLYDTNDILVKSLMSMCVLSALRTYRAVAESGKVQR